MTLVSLAIAFAAGAILGIALDRAATRAITRATAYHPEPSAFDTALTDWSDLPGIRRGR